MEDNKFVIKRKMVVIYYNPKTNEIEWEFGENIKPIILVGALEIVKSNVISNMNINNE